MLAYEDCAFFARNISCSGSLLETAINRMITCHIAILGWANYYKPKKSRPVNFQARWTTRLFLYANTFLQQFSCHLEWLVYTLFIVVKQHHDKKHALYILSHGTDVSVGKSRETLLQKEKLLLMHLNYSHNSRFSAALSSAKAQFWIIHEHRKDTRNSDIIRLLPNLASSSKIPTNLFYRNPKN